MTSHSKHVVHNTRERVLSSDFNSMQALIDAQIADTVVAAQGRGSDTTLTSSGVSGVLDGFVVRLDQPGTNSVIKISPGIAYKVVPPDDPATDSRYQRLESTSDLEVDLQPYRAGSPRWVCVCIRPNVQTVTTSTRDIWQGLLGTFAQADIPKVVASLPDVEVVTGTPAATPVLPDGVTGAIPLAYLYLDALPETALQNTDVVFCRPLYGNISSNPSGHSAGGGVEIATFASTTVQVRHVEGRWGAAGHYRVSSSFAIDLTNNNVWESGQSYATLTGNNINRYVSFYACSPPWPLGFDTDVINETREFLNLTSFFAGSGFGFTRHCIVVATVGGPSSASYLGTTGDITVTDPIWGSGGTVPASSSHYIGSATYTHAPAQGLLPQVVDGSNVRFSSFLPLQAILATDTHNSSANQKTFDPTDLNGNGKCYPPFTRTVDVVYYVNAAANAGGGYAALHDDTDPGNTFPPWRDSVVTEAFAREYRGPVRLYSATQSARLSGAESNGLNIIVNIYALGYQDPFLSQR